MKEIVRAVFEIFIFGVISVLPYTTSGFPIFAKIWKYYLCTYLIKCIKFCVFIFLSFGDMKD